MSNIVTTEYHTYEFLGNQTLRRDDGLQMKCTDLGGACLTIKKDTGWYTTENLTGLSVYLGVPPVGADYTVTRFLSSEISYNDTPISNPCIREVTRTDPAVVPVVSIAGTTNKISDLAAQGSYGAFTSYSGDIEEPFYQIYADGQQIYWVLNTSFETGGLWLRVNFNSNRVQYYLDETNPGLYGDNLLATAEVEKTSFSSEDTTFYPTNTLYIYPDDIGLSSDPSQIDELLRCFDYNNGGTWEPVDQPLTKIQFTGQGTDTTYDLEEATENYKVLGVVGNTVTIQIDDHKTVTHTYENQVGEVTLDPTGDTIIVTATTKADPDDVTCQLYQCSADPRVVDKTNYLTNIQQLSGSWVVPFDEMSPVLRINLSNNLVTSGNYCSIYSTGWGTKYYFIKNRVCVGQEVWDLYLEEDVLMTFKSSFKTAVGLIDRSETAYNLLIPDSTIPLEVGQNVTVREIPNDVFSDNYGYNYVLTGLLVGGETK